MLDVDLPFDTGVTEQVFGHIKDEFFRGREWPGFEGFKRDPDAHIVRWNTMRTEPPSYERIAAHAYKAPLNEDGVPVLPAEWDDDDE